MPRQRQGPVRCVVIAATILSVGVGIVGPAAALPARTATPPHSTGRNATKVPQATIEEKVNAIRTLGIAVDNTWLVLRDRDFVFKIFDNAKGPLVKDGALRAFKAGDTESTVFIRTGIYALDKRDKDNYAREKVRRDLARKLKQSAASLLAMPVTDQQLDLSYRDFVYQIWNFVKGQKDQARVKAAALEAFGGDEAAQKKFLETGLLKAHRQDQEDAIEADKKATEAEKARRAARDAKANAASVVLLPVDDALLNLSDDNFIRKIIEATPAGSEVANAAWAALRSTSSADWTAFIKTGIYEASKRDTEAALRKKAAEDRRVAGEIKAKAEKGGMQPRLVEAAAAALAGSDQDVANFLKDGQYAVSTQSIEATAPGKRGWYVRSDGGDTAITPGDAGTAGATALGWATWKVEPGLADPDCFSLESADAPGSYLREQDLSVRLTANDGTGDFKNAATWCSTSTLTGNGVSLESKSQPGRVLRHHNGVLWAANNSGQHDFDEHDTFIEESAWNITDPDPQVSTPIALRWLNDEDFRAAVGKPKSDEVYDDGVRYRDYDKARVYFTPATGVHDVSGPILDKYLALGGHKSRLPITDTIHLPDGRGTGVQLTDDMAIYWSPTTDAHFVWGAIWLRWRSLNFEKSYLGYPTSDEFDIPGGRRSTFEHGNIDYDWATGVTKDYRV